MPSMSYIGQMTPPISFIIIDDADYFPKPHDIIRGRQDKMCYLVYASEISIY